MKTKWRVNEHVRIKPKSSSVLSVQKVVPNVRKCCYDSYVQKVVMVRILQVNGFPCVSKTLLVDFHNFFQENVSRIHEKQMAFSQYEILTIGQSVFHPENKSSEKQ